MTIDQIVNKAISKTFITHTPEFHSNVVSLTDKGVDMFRLTIVIDDKHVGVDWLRTVGDFVNLEIGVYADFVSVDGTLKMYWLDGKAREVKKQFNLKYM